MWGVKPHAPQEGNFQNINFHNKSRNQNEKVINIFDARICGFVHGGL